MSVSKRKRICSEVGHEGNANYSYYVSDLRFTNVLQQLIERKHDNPPSHAMLMLDTK